MKEIAIEVQGAEISARLPTQALGWAQIAREHLYAPDRVILAVGQGGGRGETRLILPPATARELAHGLLDMAHELDGAGLKGGDVETCVTLVRGLVDRWGEPFENDWASVAKRGEDLVDWIGEEFMPYALRIAWPRGGEPGE